jgi:hypothetical protein
MNPHPLADCKSAGGLSQLAPAANTAGAREVH